MSDLDGAVVTRRATGAETGLTPVGEGRRDPVSTPDTDGSLPAQRRESVAMGHVLFIRPDGTETEAAAEIGQSLMQVARANLVPGIVAECGGELSCATCHVFVDERWAGLLPPRSVDEKDMLDVTAAEPTDCSRLSCQIKFTAELDGMVVTIPDVQ